MFEYGVSAMLRMTRSWIVFGRMSIVSPMRR